MLEILLEPRTAMRRMKERPPFLSFYFGSSILLAALSWTILSVNERAMTRLLSDGVRKEVVEQTRRDLHVKKLARVAGAPGEILFDASAAVMAICSGSVLCGRSPPIRTILTAAIGAEAPQLLSLATDLEHLWSEGPEVSLDLRPLVRCSTSLGAFVSLSVHVGPVECALEEISPFTIWSAGLAGIALRELQGASRGRTIAVSCAALLLRAAIGAARGAAAELGRWSAF
jgi:hypothetical protein